MIWVVALFAIIGAAVVGAIAASFIKEVIRAIRQSHRVATVSIRAGGGGRRKPTWKEWWRVFRYDFFSSYSSLRIRFIEIPHNPSEPMRACLTI